MSVEEDDEASTVDPDCSDEEDDDDDGEFSEEEGSGGEGDRSTAPAEESHALVPVVNEGAATTLALKNSTTHKAQWDKFCREALSRSKFPAELSEYYNTKKTELFNIWMDSGMNWSSCKLAVDRQVSQRNVASKGWHAVQGKTLRQQYTSEKFEKLIQERQKQGLWYEDDLFPGDLDEAWFFVRVGEKVKQDNETLEKLTLTAKADVNDDMRAALTDAADGVLRPGALPSTSAVGKDGNKALLDALGKAVAIAKPKRSKERDGLADPVKPQTTEEKLSSYMQDLLAHAATARTQSIKLSTVGYATELSAQLLDHAKKLEVTFKTGQDALKIKDEKEMTALIKKVDKLIAFGDQAKASYRSNRFQTNSAAAAAFLRPSSKGRAKAKAKANTKTKRRRLPLESYEQSATVTKLTDLIGRGQVSIAAAADIARCVVRSAVEKVIAEVFSWSMKCCSSGIAYMALELVPSPWTAVPGFRLETIAWDLLHNVFLGTGRDLVASAIRVLIREGIYDHVGSSELDVILSAVHEEIRTTCKQNGFYLPPKPVLSEANMGGSDYAEIGTRYKASHVKCLIWWAAQKTRQVADVAPDNVQLQVLATCCWGVQRCIEISDHAGLILDVIEAKEASDALRTHIRCFAWLSLHYHDLKTNLFKVRPKSHYICHMADSLVSSRMNFNSFHTFDEESFLGKIKAICQKTHGRTMTQRVFQRYRLCLALFLHQSRQLEAQLD
ncbi:unnamed protein product [Durusdinium trenchii]|uniref:Uncharacterized protein n=1 Tax=Durusdinium trenchii TaxID=1381693 RepID=A0ABP0J366_9DINO